MIGIIALSCVGFFWAAIIFLVVLSVIYLIAIEIPLMLLCSLIFDDNPPSKPPKKPRIIPKSTNRE